MSEDKLSVMLPTLDDVEEDKHYRRHAVVLGGKLAIAIAEYLKSFRDSENPPTAYSIGAACYVAAHVMTVDLDKERATQLKQALVATAMLNEESLFDLASIPTDVMN